MPPRNCGLQGDHPSGHNSRRIDKYVVTSGVDAQRSEPPLEPFRDYLLVKAQAEGARTTSGFVLPGNTLGQPTFAQVERVGDEVPSSIEVGDVIVYKHTEAVSIYLEGSEFFLVKASAVMGRMSSTSS